MILFSVSSLLCPLAENFLHYRIMWHLSVFQAWGWSQNISETGQLAPDSEDNSPYFVILKNVYCYT